MDYWVCYMIYTIYIFSHRTVAFSRFGILLYKMIIIIKKALHLYWIVRDYTVICDISVVFNHAGVFGLDVV